MQTNNALFVEKHTANNLHNVLRWRSLSPLNSISSYYDWVY